MRERERGERRDKRGVKSEVKTFKMCICNVCLESETNH